MKRRIAILEDDARRREAMDRALQQADIAKPTFFLSAGKMVAAIHRAGFSADLISLDHDLEPSDDDREPGTGRDVADALAKLDPICPVIVHSTNHPAAVGMEFVLTDRGWRVERIMPYDDLAWVAEAWLPLVIELLNISSGSNRR
jgi:DNA-binding NtrC family response regulator